MVVSQRGGAGRSNNIVVPVRSNVLVRQPDVRITQAKAPKNKIKLPMLSQCGLDFLKCAFALPDFDSTGTTGIPDNFVGKTVCSLQTITQSLSAPAGADTYFLISPFLGSSYLTATTASVGAAPSTFTSQNWPSFVNLGLGSTGSTANTVGKFRFAGLAAEIQPTMNEMTWAGNITCFKVPLTVSIGPDLAIPLVGGVPVVTAVANGLGALQTNPVGNVYTAPFNRGVYSQSVNKSGAFDFQPAIFSVNFPSANENIPVPGGTLNLPYRGMDNFDTIVFRVSVPAGASAQSFILRTWACVELQVTPSSLAYEFVNNSCPHDQAALDMYKLVAERLPIAVPYQDNADFWKRVWAFIRSASASMSALPGPMGQMAGGVSMLTSGISSLVF